MSFTNVPDPEMVVKSAAVTVAFTPEKYAHLISLLPTSQGYAALHERYEASYAAALKGDPEKVKACEADRQAVNKDLSILFGVAKVVAIVDPTVPEALGLGPITEKTSAPAGDLSEPTGFKVIYDPKGEITASMARVIGAKGYQLWGCDSDPSIEANWKMVASSTNCRKIVIPGLNRAKANWLKARAIRGKTVGPWSNIVFLPA
jgi:hypothetical protein